MKFLQCFLQIPQLQLSPPNSYLLYSATNKVKKGKGDINSKNCNQNPKFKWRMYTQEHFCEDNPQLQVNLIAQLGKPWWMQWYVTISSSHERAWAMATRKYFQSLTSYNTETHKQTKENINFKFVVLIHHKMSTQQLFLIESLTIWHLVTRLNTQLSNVSKEKKPDSYLKKVHKNIRHHMISHLTNTKMYKQRSSNVCKRNTPPFQFVKRT